MSVIKRRAFPESFKREAVDRVATSGLSAGAVARELGLHETVLRRWIMQFGTQARGRRGAPTRRRRPRRRLTWPRRTLAFVARTIGFGWSAIS